MLEKVQIIKSADGDPDSDSECSATDDEDDAADTARCDFIRDIDLYVSCLMDLLPTLEHIISLDQKEIETNKAPAPVSFRVSEPATFFVSHILDKFRNSDKRLVERLGEANWQRHLRIRSQMADADEPAEAVQRNETPVAQSIFVPRSFFHDSGLGPSVPGQSTYAASVASHTSFISSLADINKGSLRVPPTPKEVELRKPFQCDICGYMLSNIKTRVDWK